MKREKWLRPVGRGKVRKALQQKKFRRQVPTPMGLTLPTPMQRPAKTKPARSTNPRTLQKVRPKAKAAMKEVTTARSLTKKSRGCSWGNHA